MAAGDLGIAVSSKAHPAKGVDPGGEPDLSGATHDTIGIDAIGIGEWREIGSIGKETLHAVCSLWKRSKL